MAHTRVPNTRKISRALSKLFFNLNCKGVKEKLKIKLRINGTTIISGICLCHNIKKTLPNDNAIKTYKNVQTGPNIHAGGDQEGFFNCEYQLYVFTHFIITPILLFSQLFFIIYFLSSFFFHYCFAGNCLPMAF